MIKRILLVGNPNVGKSAVFSRLTGVQVITSNYPGTTVEIAKGFLKIREEKIEVIDLPGTYSLEPSSPAEEVAVRLLKESGKDDSVVINVIDATNLERNLFLSLQLIEQGYPLILCLNMCDDTVHRGIDINIQKLESLLGVPVIPTCAVTGVGIKMLIEKINSPKTQEIVVDAGHRKRWEKIGEIVEQSQHLTHRHHNLREILEDASVRPLSGLFMSVVIIFASFKFVRFLGEYLINTIFDPFFANLYQPLVEKLSNFLGRSGFLHHLLIGDFVLGSIDFKQSMGLLTTAPYIEFAMVLPYLFSFYLVLSLLEDVGYLPRLAMLLDNIFHRIGLHGFAVIPVLLGFGCNVPGILATRSLESKRERFIASTLISIGVPCVPLQAMIFGLLGQLGGFYVSGVYLTLFSIVIILGVILNRTVKGYSPEFLLEIPPYRIPPLDALLKKIYMRIKGFIVEAVPVVLLGVFIINIMIYFKVFDLVTTLTSPIITGLFGLPKEAVVALAIGFLRKDIAVGMLVPLGMTAKQLFISTTLLAISFPCIATFVILSKELGLKDLLKAIAIMTFISLIVGVLLNFCIVR